MIAQRTTGRALRPTVLVPRELCVFESMPCAGVRLHEQRGFARMQATRLSPFAQGGANAAIRAGTLMLWFWDDAEVSAALREAGLPPERTRRLVESLLLPAPAGTADDVRVPCLAGTDVQAHRNGAIVKSHWQAAAPGPEPLLRRFPWSRELLGQGTSETGRWPLARMLAAAAMAGAAGCACFAAYWGGALAGAQHQLDTLQAGAEAGSSRLGSLADTRRSEKEDRAWVDAYRRSAGSVQIDQLLQALMPAMETFGVAIKEIEVRNDDVRLLVTSAGVEIDLPNLLRALARVPGLQDVQLRQNTELMQASFSMRATGFVGLPQPATTTP